MTNKQLERCLAQLMGALRPETDFDTVAEAVAASSASADPASVIAFRPRSIRRYVAAVAAACLVALLAVGGVMYHRQYRCVETVIDIDVNPGIELSVNRAAKVLSAEAVNSDGRNVLKELKLKRKPLSEAVDIIFEEMVAQGYVVGEGNCILVTVQNADSDTADRIHRTVADSIEVALAQHDISAPVATQTVADFDAVVAFAEENGISKGKANFILGLVEQDASLKAEKLAEYPFSSLAAIAQNMGIPFNSLTDYDAVFGLNKQLAEALEKEAAEFGAVLLTDLLSPEEAKEKALSYLRDWEAEQALFVKAELTWNDGKPVYQFELIVRNQVYEFAVNALDGSYETPDSQQKPVGTTTTTKPNGPVIVYSTLPGGGTAAHFSDPPKVTTTTSPDEWISAAPTATPTQSAVTVRPTFSEDGEVGSNDWAKAIVFRLLRITEEEARAVSVARLPSRLENGVEEISVRFIYDDAIRVVYVHSVSGAVIKTVYLPLSVSVETFRINEWEAQDIALRHAGVSEGECIERTIMYGMSDADTPYIFVMFVVGRHVYGYQISGVDGSVLSYEIKSF